MGKPLAFGAAAAVAGAVVWGLLRIYGDMEHGVVAWGIGGLVGIAVVKAGGHGTVLAACAGVLALLSISTGKNISYRAYLDTDVQDATPQEAFDEMSADAKAWVALGDNPSTEQIQKYADDQGFEVDDPTDFATNAGPELKAFAEHATLEEWRAAVHSDYAGEFSFIDYLREDFHVLDILFAVLGIGTAFGLVQRRTMELMVAERERLRREREAEAEAEAATEEESPS